MDADTFNTFTAEKYFSPTIFSGVSKTEEAYLDFAILKMNSNPNSGIAIDLLKRGIPYLSVKISEEPNKGDRVSVWGSPYQPDEYGTGFFSLFRINKQNYVIKQLYVGDYKFKNTYLTMLLEIPIGTLSIQGSGSVSGRSGSPILHNGLLVGVHGYAAQAESLGSLSDYYEGGIPTTAIYKILEDYNLSNIFYKTY